MKILEGHEKEYKDYCNEHSTGGSKLCLEYSERWAELLEQEIDQTDDVMKCITDNADRLSLKADTIGISGFMYRYSINILSHYWKYGDYLKKWHENEYNFDNNKNDINKSVTSKEYCKIDNDEIER